MSKENDEIISRVSLHKAFPGIPDDEAQKLLDKGKITRFPSDSVLCQEDQTEDVFYILLEGEVKVTKRINDSEDRFLKHLHPGDFFGEMGIIQDAPRAASVTTTRDSSVFEINKESFEIVLHQSSTVSLAMAREVSRRLRENDEMAIEDLRTKARELADAYQKLAEFEVAKSEFLTTIAHELRTPLASAGGFMQVISMGMMEGEALKSALATVARNIERITDLVNDILSLQEMDLILADFEPIDINELVNKVIDEERPFADEMQIDIRTEIAPNLPLPPGDLTSLDRALHAILNNAIKFSINGGFIQVTVDHSPAHVWISISDPGIGIPEKDLPYIFDRFWRTEEHDDMLFGGVGIGLSIAKQVIEQHNGQIEVKRGQKVGTTFTIRLPLTAAETPSEEKTT